MLTSAGLPVITAIALLFDRTNRESVHTIALFSSAVLILMPSTSPNRPG